MTPKRKKRGHRPPGAPNHSQRPGPGRPRGHHPGTSRPGPRPAHARPRGPIAAKEPPLPEDYNAPPTGPVTIHEGVLEMHPKGYGFLRTTAHNYLAQPSDPYVPAPLIHKLGLREGMRLTGPVEAARGTMGPRLIHVDAIEEID